MPEPPAVLDQCLGDPSQLGGESWGLPSQGGCPAFLSSCSNHHHHPQNCRPFRRSSRVTGPSHSRKGNVSLTCRWGEINSFLVRPLEHCVVLAGAGRARGEPGPSAAQLETEADRAQPQRSPPLKIPGGKLSRERESLSRGGFSTVANTISTQVKFLLLSCITFNYPHHPKNIPQLPSGQNYAYF